MFGALKNFAKTAFGYIKSGGEKIYGAVNTGLNVLKKLEYDPKDFLYDVGKWSKGHLTVPGGYRYTGPFNPIDNGAPINETDRAGFVHDLEYGAIRRAIDRGDIKKDDRAGIRRAVKEADNRFYDILDNAPEYTNSSTPLIHKISNRLGYYGIKAKEKLQDIGLLSPEAFVARKGGLVKKPRLK